MKKAGVMMLSLASLVFGCRDKSTDEHERMMTDMRNNISISKDILLTDRENAVTHDYALMKKIWAIPDLATRRSLFDFWEDIYFSFDLTRIPCDGSGHRGRCCGAIQEFAENLFADPDLGTVVERWKVYLRYCEWLRGEVRKVAAKREYPKGVRRVWDASGKGDWRVDSKCWDKLQEYRAWVDTYNGLSYDYEMRIWTKEWKFPSYSYDMTEAERKEVRAVFESYLGRALRTAEQVRSDHAKKRRVEFPAYVPTPEGIRECWTEDEAKKANRKPE